LRASDASAVSSKEKKKKQNKTKKKEYTSWYVVDRSGGWPTHKIWWGWRASKSAFCAEYTSAVQKMESWRAAVQRTAPKPKNTMANAIPAPLIAILLHRGLGARRTTTPFFFFFISPPAPWYAQRIGSRIVLVRAGWLARTSGVGYKPIASLQAREGASCALHVCSPHQKERAHANGASWHGNDLRKKRIDGF